VTLRRALSSRIRQIARPSAVILATVCALMPAAPAAAQQGPLDGQPIVRIVFKIYDIFDTSDPATSKWFYRAANSLHIKSKESLIRSKLLFAEGDPYSEAAAQESARILRALRFINPVHITAREVDGGVEVTVETHDQWTLEFGASFGIVGDRQDWSVEFQEKNFLGYGKKVDFDYTSDVERTERVIGYYDPNILGSWWLGELRYADRSDGFRELVRLERPFYSLATNRAWGGTWERDNKVDYLYSEGSAVVSGPRKIESATVWFGRRFLSTNKVTRRYTVGFEHNHDRFEDWKYDEAGAPFDTPDDILIDGPRATFERVTDRFEVLHGFRAWSIQEDVAFGPNVSLGATLSLPELGGDMPRLVLDGTFDMAHHRDGWLFLGEAHAGGRLDDGDPQNWVVGAWIGAAQLGKRGWQMRLLADVGHQLDRQQQLTLGADIGLRGWSPDYFDGTSRALANVQWRMLVFEEVAHILALGFEVFADAGATWGPRVGQGTDGVRADAGVGIIGDLTKIGLKNIARVEIGWGDDGSGPTVIVSTSSLF
jgi:hypothetical protein